MEVVTSCATDWIDSRCFNMAWEWSNMMDHIQDQRNSLVPFQVLQWTMNSAAHNITNARVG